LRAKEDYLMGINFSRLLSLKYGNSVAQYLGKPYIAIAVGRVMTCVLGMVVKREREIREFVKTPFYRILANLGSEDTSFECEWKALEGSRYFQSPLLYKENGFRKKEDAKILLEEIKKTQPFTALVESLEKKKEKKNPPLLYNLAELQNECSRLFKISPDETLKITQELYEKKLVTYPRTDARVLSSAVAKEITKNLRGLVNYDKAGNFAGEILSQKAYLNLTKSRYVNDKQITDHYAIIPTGQGTQQTLSLSATSQKVYEIIVRRFLSIFYPAATYQKISVTTKIGREPFFSSLKFLLEEGYLKVIPNSFEKKNENISDNKKENLMKNLKKGNLLDISKLFIKEGETSPPKRYTSGSMILAMENAGQLIEDEELRSQIKGSGIGTSATRAEILKKLISIRYLKLNKKTQIISPELLGEMIFDVVNNSIRSLLNPELTASWEKGLTLVAEGTITEEEYMEKLEHFIKIRTEGVKGVNNQYSLRQYFDKAKSFYKMPTFKKRKDESKNE
ncbi:MAG TPA: DNA topoisomerase, partial [Lachnospiraceae bacterium]